MKKDPTPYLRHMLDSAEAVMNFASKHTYEELVNSDWNKAALIRNLEIIGEASTNISVEFRKQNPQIPWQDIIDFRNVAIHEYMEVDLHIVWNIVTLEIPILIDQLQELLQNKKGA